MFYSYISLKNSFISYDYETFVGQGLFLDWSDRENFVQRTQDAKMMSTFVNPIEKSILTPPPLPFQWISYFVLKTSR